MSRLKRIRTRINKENLKKAQKEGHITDEQAQEVIDTNGLYNPYTDTYINPNILPEISVVAKAPERTWTSEWTYNDPEFRLAREHRNIAAQEVAKSTRDKMNQVGNAIGKTVIGGISFTPLWFAAPIAKAGIAASEGDYSGAAKEAAVGLLAPYAIGKGLQKGYSAYQAYRGWQNGLNEAVAKGFQNAMTPVQTSKYGTIKYYGPTMGKTTAVKTNPRLVDFDDIVREEIQQLANKKGISVRELKTKSDIEYTQLLENAVYKWQANPANKDKTLLISNSALSNKPIFDNTPVIPSKNQFIARQVARGESDPTYAAQYYDDLLKRNPQLKIDDRFVNEIESGTRSAKISESELAGIPKVDRNQKIKPHDYFYSLGKYVNPKAYQKHMLELFNSPEYKQRLLDRGFSEVGAQAVIDNNIKAINQAKIRIQPSTSPGFPSGASGYANGHKVSLAEPLFGGDFTKGNNYDNVLHELGHVSDNTRFNDLFWKLQPKVEIKLSTTADKNYLLQPTEVRTRALGVIDWMRKNNKSIDDFYNMGKSYNPLFNEGVDPLFNKRAFEFFHNYTEDSGRKYLQTFYKKGGKLNYLNYIK